VKKNNTLNPIDAGLLPLGWEQGFTIASQTRRNAYVPYSGFAVGFALHVPGQDQSTDDHFFVPGSNVENVSFGGTICAERAALVSAISQFGKQSFDFGVLVTDSEPPVLPCALCLQVISELCGPSFTVVVCDLLGPRGIYRLDELLPHRFEKFPGMPTKKSEK
jgi:homotetrameric cytidine deaminase